MIVNHFNPVEIRVEGSGNLRLRLLSRSATKTVTLNPIVMSTATAKTEIKKVNFKQEFAQLEIKTTGYGEYFVIDRIAVFSKPIASAYPG